MSTVLDSLHSALERASRVLVATHVNPDGDAIGSAAALAHIALHAGCETRIFAQVKALPVFLSWLPLPVPLARSLTELGDWSPDLLICVDCGDAKRAGPELHALLTEGKLPQAGWKGVVTANIDHHASNDGFADINWVEPHRSAAGEMVGVLAESMGIRLGGDLGQALFLALASDTGNFSYANTSAASLAMASRIVVEGLDVAAFTELYENNWSLARMHLWGRLMGEVTLHADGAVACSVVPRSYLDEMGLKIADLEGFASWLRKIRGVRVALFVREDGTGRAKISLRSMGDIDVGAVTALYQGGGHAAAAGAELPVPPQEAAKLVLEQIIQRL